MDDVMKIYQYLLSNDGEMRQLGVTLCNNHPSIKKHFPTTWQINHPDERYAEEMAKARIRVLIKRDERKNRTT